ncbi:hypothetical protein LKD70_14220 [Ruminococcus sp. CLA-AA-H200]|uniref:Macro domain-containing protein n=1 Tax=Ruminococcus turbiniformis TaxID=2881258 RepID=A0ABS8G024_9FIRM|nr:hypothetical protein [Ruminococcus turbiniformis]MCC2255556.1 hypothetical protein [Ruminococcus turbiniformis]
MIREVKKNLLDTESGIIAHQVNCKGIMGAGVAKQIRNRLLTSGQYSSYKAICENAMPETLLGTSIFFRCNQAADLVIANMFAENIPTGRNLDTDYDALKACLLGVKHYGRSKHLPIAIPGYLGCGLAGGDWRYVFKHIITPIFKDYPYGLTICYLPGSIKQLWEEFGNVPMDPETECIEEEWHGFPEGTHREEIWHWFEESFQVSVAKDLMGQDNRKQQDAPKKSLGKRVYDNRYLESLLTGVVSCLSKKDSGISTLTEIGFTPEDMEYFGLPADRIPQNTMVTYLYRDRDNHKIFSRAIVPGTLNEKEKKEIWESTEEGEFLPGQVGLPDDNRYSGTEADGPWFELMEVTETGQRPTQVLTAAGLLRNFRKAANHWDVQD